jgi:hypothetical protein
MVILKKRDRIGPVETIFPKNNLILRDIDGQPVWVRDYKELMVGEAMP